MCVLCRYSLYSTINGWVEQHKVNGLFHLYSTIFNGKFIDGLLNLNRYFFNWSRFSLSISKFNESRFNHSMYEVKDLQWPWGFYYNFIRSLLKYQKYTRFSPISSNKRLLAINPTSHAMSPLLTCRLPPLLTFGF